jgi:hypothetical protein
VKNAASGKKRARPSELHKRVCEWRKLLVSEELTMVQPNICKSTCALFRIRADFPQQISNFAVTPDLHFTPNLRGFPRLRASYSQNRLGLQSAES